VKKASASSPLSEEALLATADSLRTVDDRTAVLITAAWIDDALSELFRRNLLDRKKEQDDLLKPEGPLGSSFVKAKLGYMLGWIYPDLYAELRRLREIRNLFAHSREMISLSRPSLRDRCRALQLAEAFNMGGPIRPARSPRQRLIISAVLAARQILRTAAESSAPREVTGIAPVLTSIRSEVKSATIRQMLEILRGA
jgi:DNA-binding MltR family transcriptional regulator